ncbi:MAG: HAMP domain-containing sensor histidine kinase [Acidobacteriaceae bacterium]
MLVWLIRKLLSPVHALAHAAEEITSSHWHFNAPPASSQFVELLPLEAAIERTIARLQASFEQQKRFTSDAAHELKTDLAIVKSSLQLLTMKTRSIDEHQRGLMAALDDLTRLERTVHKMLTLARAERQEDRAIQTCRIDEVLQTIVQQTASLADLRSISISTASVTPATVPLDSEEAALLLSNIVLNALQHSPEHARVEVASQIKQQKMHLFIRDYGEGINESDGPLIFEPFYRGDRSRSRKTGGTGLGLSICKAICDRVGGTIAIANHTEGGALVTVILPISTP